ncbi:helix-turn-helix domain-containing protein [Streptomyces radicis]|uniref:XRE family transcriptional regulator n=1 Tax=Streptomyces radicis TaxID=1750517 RepID=A0A3A9WEM3_9ACTN|nr:helix-turn-helix transcriptional regulator [Streptomyces radicis]RKN11062.1 XRE family transcriptional regulator [Streptomyces radicis]RKN25325.1 XRE family transcriptional regulator [Streptomyces radicis]
MELINEGGDLSPNARLGRRVRRLRLDKGLSLRQLSERITGYSHSYIARVEVGKQGASDALVKALDEFFGTGGTLAEIKDMARETVIAQYSREYVRREGEATLIQAFTSSVIPGLLQTREYARELFRTRSFGNSEEELAAQVATRMLRQDVFLRDDPPYYSAVIDEAALRRPTVDIGIMRDQVAHLLESAANPQVTVQVLPFDQGVYPMLGGSLDLLTLKSGRTVALVESFRSGDVVHSSASLLELVQYFDVTRSKALPASDSLDLMRNYLKEYER